jgi:hypothetical protein
VSDPKVRADAETMRAIQREAAEDAIDEIAAMSPSEVDASLRSAGVEPEEASQRAQAAIEAALAASEPAKVVPLSAARPRKGTPPWIVWTGVAAAAAAVALVVRMNAPSNDVGASRPSPEKIAERARATALAACGRQDYDACERGLDDARDEDPAGEDTPAVRDARAAIARWHQSRGLEAPAPTPGGK